MRYDVTFMTELVAQIPELEPLYSEHMQDNFGEMLPHVLMGDVTRFAVAKSQTLTGRF